MTCVKIEDDKKPNTKADSKKYPLTLVVASEIRKQEVETLVTDARLYAVVDENKSEDAVKSIVELNAILRRALR